MFLTNLGYKKDAFLEPSLISNTINFPSSLPTCLSSTTPPINQPIPPPPSPAAMTMPRTTRTMCWVQMSSTPQDKRQAEILCWFRQRISSFIGSCSDPGDRSGAPGDDDQESAQSNNLGRQALVPDHCQLQVVEPPEGSSWSVGYQRQERTLEDVVA
jgi:hypothetical protein